MQVAKKAFSLVEAAIVLGVIGLVIGGIWIAASAVYTANKLDQLETGLLSLYNQLHERYPYALVGSRGYFPLPVADIDSLSIPAGFERRAGGLILDPFGGQMTTTGINGFVGIDINTDMWSSVSSARLIGISIMNELNPDGTVRSPYKCNRLVPRLTSMYKLGGDLEQVAFCNDSSCGSRTIVTSSSFPVAIGSAYCQNAYAVLLGFRN